MRKDFPDAPEDGDPRLLSAIRNRLGAKIWRCCDYARVRGYPYLWIDTCCIDKTSSAELSEAINSMFDWYSQAAVCYVFLFDVSAGFNPAAKDSSFRRSMWFKRGWTLQELIVPSRSVFLSMDWQMIGTKASLASTIEDITLIDADVLLHRRGLHTVSVAQRMAWASRRETTRIEDEAYCLMGIFGVRLPVIYGEGPQAFARLQEEIMRRIPDQSLFAWGIESNLHCISLQDSRPSVMAVPTDKVRASKSAYLFASSPVDFRHSNGLSPIPLDTFASILELPKAIYPPRYNPSGYGVRTTFPVCTLCCSTQVLDSLVEVQCAILACQDAQGRLPVLILFQEGAGSQCLVGGFQFLRAPGTMTPPLKPSSPILQIAGRSSRNTTTTTDMHHLPLVPRIVLLDPSVLNSASPGFVTPPILRKVCIPHQCQSVVSGLAILRRPAKRDRFKGLCKVILPCWTLEHLSALGLSVDGAVEDGRSMVPVPLSLRHRHGDTRGAQWYHNFTLSHTMHQTITVAVFTCPSSDYLGPLHASVEWGPQYYSGANFDTKVRKQVAVAAE